MLDTHMPRNSSWRWNNPMPSAAVRLRSLPRRPVRSFCQVDTTGQRRCLHWTLSSRPCHIPGASWSPTASVYLIAQLTYRQINTGVRGGTFGWGTALQSRNVTGSITDGVTEMFHWHNPSGRTMALGSTQPLTEMSTRNISWGVKTAGA